MFHSRIYIAEEDQQLQRRLCAALRANGFDVTTSDNGYSIVEMMDSWPDIFLIDIELHGVNGLEVCKWLKSHESSRNIPVIFISGEPYLKILASSTPADDYIEKPVSVPDVIKKIQQFIVVEKER